MQPESKPSPQNSILILTFTKPELALARVHEVMRFFGYRDDTELIVFNNGGGPRANLPFMNLGYEDKALKFYLESIDKNAGFGGGWNEAVKRSRGDIIYLLSDDVRITGDFIAPIAMAMTPGAIVGQEMIGHRAGWNEFATFKISYLMGYFYSMARSTWDELGGFDAETFYPYDYEDVDLCYRAQQAGMTLLDVPSLPIHHEVAGTIGYNPDRYENTVLQRARFAEKHGLSNVPERP